MTSAPILRSAALQKLLAIAPPAVRGPASRTFASTLASSQARVCPGVSRASAAGGRPRPAASGNVPFKDQITAAARKYGVDPALLAAVVKQESNFNPNAQSGSGAKGLTQLMDSTARGLGVADPFDPAQSLEGGARFLSSMLKQFHGNESLALAAYNAGPVAVQKYGGIPPYEETQRYVPKVLGYASQFRRVWADSTPSPATLTQAD